MANLTKIITRVRVGLKWRIKDAVHNSRDFEIVSDPWDRTHTISWPAAGDQPREIEYLHELAHAWLAEHMHPLIGSASFRLGIDPDTIIPLTYPLRIAADWFADALLRSWAQIEADSQVREHVVYVLDPKWRVGINTELVYQGGLIVAEAKLWNLKPIKTPPVFQPVVNLLLAFPPDKPSIGKMQTLVNRLASLTTDLRVRVIAENGIDVWDLTKG